MNCSEKRILVTGSTGFVGRNLCLKLRERGAATVVAPSRSDCDLTRQSSVEAFFASTGPFDIVFHLAGLVGGIGANVARPAAFFHDNILMGTFVLHYAAAHGAGKFVAAAAGCGYPEHAPMPLNESDFWNGFPQAESAPYSLAKRLLDIQAMAYASQYSMKTAIVVPGNVYGPFDHFASSGAHVVPSLIHRISEAHRVGAKKVCVWGSGSQSRDFVYVGDLVDGMLLAAERDVPAGVMNLSSGTETTIGYVAGIIAQLLGYRGELVWNGGGPEGQRRRFFDISKAREALGWTPSVAIEEGLAKTVQWYRTAAARSVASAGPDRFPVGVDL